jgi:3'(2'), 5'-bisphosphate nucleotidase
VTGRTLSSEPAPDGAGSLPGSRASAPRGPSAGLAEAVARVPGSDTRYARERRAALEAVRQASLLCRAVRASFQDSHATAKADLSPVTVADLGAQALISLALAGALPDDPIMGEEESAPLRADPSLAGVVLARVREAHPAVGMRELLAALDRCDDAGGAGRRWWTLDPVDGTKGFLRDEQYAVALALVEDGEVVLGVLGCPNLPESPAAVADLGQETTASAAQGCLFVAERGQGAWQMPLSTAPDPGAARRIAVGDERIAADARYAESVEAAHSNQAESAAIAARLGVIRAPIRMDSQAKYAVVGRGEASIYLRLPHGGYVENVWDHAAGSVIVREAGGAVSDADGKPLDFTAGTRLARNRGIVATAAAIHEEVVGAVREALGR